MTPLDDPDVSAAVTLMSRVAATAGDVVERRRVLMEGLAELLAADVWVWFIGRGTTNPGPAPLAVIDGGFRDDAERAAVYRANANPHFLAAVNRMVDVTRHATFGFDPAAVPPDPSFDPHRWLASTGLAHLLFSVYPLGDGATSGLGLHRRAGREPYTQRDRDLLHLIAAHVDFLHRGGTDVPANAPVSTGISPRMHETLVYILNGDSRKQAARKMALSEHTVGDHIKALYKHYGVNSRAELLAMFVGKGGGGTT